MMSHVWVDIKISESLLGAHGGKLVFAVAG